MDWRARGTDKDICNVQNMWRYNAESTKGPKEWWAELDGQPSQWYRVEILSFCLFELVRGKGGRLKKNIYVYIVFNLAPTPLKFPIALQSCWHFSFFPPSNDTQLIFNYRPGRSKHVSKILTRQSIKKETFEILFTAPLILLGR